MRRTAIAAVVLTLAMWQAQAVIPAEIHFQGRLTDGAGTPITAAVDITFTLYDADVGDSEIWTETYSGVTPADGLFSVTLGANVMNPLKMDMFRDNPRLYLGVQVDPDPEMTPRYPVCTAAYAFVALHADNADTVDGQDASAFAAATHNHDGRYYTQTQVNALLATQNARITALETKLASVTATATDVYFSGVNVHVRSGSGATNGGLNGRGNLIVGYNENNFFLSRTGSHNLVLGIDNEYTSYAGLVAGRENFVTGAYASVTGGRGNVASASYSSVSGGYANWATGPESSVLGGAHNEAAGTDSSVSGGLDNTANGTCASVSGGDTNAAGGDYSTVGGGLNRTVAGINDWRAGNLFENE